MKRILSILIVFCLILAWQIPQSKTQVKVTGKGSGTVTRTITNAVDGKTTLEDGSSKIRVADPFYSAQTLTVNSTTPSIASYSAFKTANSSTTAITTLNGLTDSTYIKVVFIRIGDANTSFVHSAYFDCDGTDLSPSSGDIIRAVWSGLASPNGKWLIKKLDSYTFEDMIISSGLVYDVTHPHYGAIVDDQLTDEPAIQEAADSINANGGGILYFPRGTYEFFGEDVRIYSNTTVFAHNATFNDTTGGSRFFFVSGASYVTFLGGEWDGNADIDGGYTEQDHGIDILNSYTIRVENAYMHDLAGDCIQVSGGDRLIVTNCDLYSTHLQDSPFIGRNGIAIVGGDDYLITNNFFRGGDPAAIDVEPVTDSSATNVIISHNEFIGGQYAINLGEGTRTNVDTVKIMNNLISNTLEISIRVQSATHWEILNNTIKGSQEEGIHIRPSTTSGVIDGNVIYKSVKAGILLNDSHEGIVVTNNKSSYNIYHGIWVAGSNGSENKFLTIARNICWNNDRADASTYSGLLINYTDSSYVENNLCYDDQGASATQTYGFSYNNMDVNVIGLGNTGWGNTDALNSWTSIGGEILNDLTALQWVVDNPAAGASLVAMTVSGSESVALLTMPYGGHIIAMSAQTTVTLNAQTITFTLTKNGSTSNMGSVQLTTTDSVATTNFLTYTDTGHTFAKGDIIGVNYTTHASYAPTTLDHVVAIYIKH